MGRFKMFYRVEGGFRVEGGLGFSSDWRGHRWFIDIGDFDRRGHWHTRGMWEGLGVVLRGSRVDG